MSDVKTSEHFHGQDQYHRAYFHKIDAPAPVREDRVDPNLPDLDRDKVVDPDPPKAPTRSGREESGKGAEPKPEPKAKPVRSSGEK